MKHIFLSLALVSGLSVMPAAAQDAYPERAVEITVAQPAGGIIDIVARMVADHLAQDLGQPFIIANRTGGGGIIGAQYVLQSAPDGYNLLVLGSSLSFNQALGGAPYEYPEQFTTIAQFGVMPSLFAVPADFPAETVEDFVAFALANPGQVNFGSAGSGSGGHIFTSAFAEISGTDMVHVPFTGAPAVANAMLTGDIDLFLGPVPVLAPFIERGEIKALAVASPERLPQLPDVPTMDEAGYQGFVGAQYVGLWGPEGLPEEIVGALNASINSYLDEPEVAQRLSDMGFLPVTQSPDEFLASIEADVQIWSEFVERLGGVLE